MGGGRGSRDSALFGRRLRDRLGHYDVVRPALSDARDFQADPLVPATYGLSWADNWRHFDDRFGLRRVDRDATPMVLLLASAAPTLTLADGSWYRLDALQVLGSERGEGVGALGLILAAARAIELECRGILLHVLSDRLSTSAESFFQKCGARPADDLRSSDGRPLRAEPECSLWCIPPPCCADLNERFQLLSR
jgi:hypothetical protein